MADRQTSLRRSTTLPYTTHNTCTAHAQSIHITYTHSVSHIIRTLQLKPHSADIQSNSVTYYSRYLAQHNFKAKGGVSALLAHKHQKPFLLTNMFVHTLTNTHARSRTHKQTQKTNTHTHTHIHTHKDPHTQTHTHKHRG